MSAEWTLWAERRPIDVNVMYRWRIPARPILGMILRPEWNAMMSFVGMGHEKNKWWPPFSNWDGYTRTVPDGTEWRVAVPDDAPVFWGGMDLLPCPFTGQPPTVGYHGQWVGAPPYKPEWLSIRAWMVDSNGWKDAKKMAETWNRRAVKAI